MGCACGNNAPQQVFVANFADGSTGTFETRLAAQMAMAKKGGGGTITAQAKPSTT